MSLELFPVQREAVEKIEKAFFSGIHKGFILADGCGVGKSATAIELVKRTPGVKIILCPAYLLWNWGDECEMWGIDKNDICVIDSGKQILENKQIYLVAYSRIANPAILKQLLKKRFSLIVCDESQALKSWNSKRSRYVLGTFQNTASNLLARSDRILLLSGTPVLNRIEELYDLVIRVAPKTLDYMTKYQFYQIYAGWIENTGFKIVAHGVKNEDDLKKRLAPIMLRRTKIEGLKEREEETIKLDPRAPALKKLFAQEEAFLSSHGIKPGDVEGLTKLTKIEVSEIAEVRAKIALAKIPAALEMLADIREEQEEPRPVTIYCYHRAVLKALEAAIRDKFPKLRAAFIDGQTDAKRRHDITKNHFQTGKLDVLCATIGALREGINLTTGADVLFVELSYVPADVEQAIGRFHRRGQKNIVRVRKLVFMAGIEKRILTILNEKSTTIKKIIGD